MAIDPSTTVCNGVDSMHDAQALFSRFRDILTTYNTALATSIDDEGRVPEFVAHGENTKAPRQLCQTRGIIYNVHMAREFGDRAAAARAVDIYQSTRQHYLTPCTLNGQPAYAPVPTNDGAAMYELAFLLNAQVQLHYLDGLLDDPSVLDKAALDADMTVTEDAILAIPTASIFQPREGGDFSELNAGMHLFEAIALRLQLSDHAELRHKANALLEHVDNHFWDDVRGMLAERIDGQNTILEYDLGHNYEWSSLLSLNSNLGLNYRRLDPMRLAAAAEEIAWREFEPEMVAFPLDAETRPLDRTARIWVSLERIRALALAGDERVLSVMARVLEHFFPENLPEEYSGTRGPIKSTTGYHVIESYVGTVHALKA